MMTPLRSIRIGDDLWTRGLVAADALGSDLSTEIRGFVERLADDHERRENHRAGGRDERA